MMEIDDSPHRFGMSAASLRAALQNILSADIGEIEAAGILRPPLNNNLSNFETLIAAVGRAWEPQRDLLERSRAFELPPVELADRSGSMVIYLLIDVARDVAKWMRIILRVGASDPLPNVSPEQLVELLKCLRVKWSVANAIWGRIDERLQAEARIIAKSEEDRLSALESNSPFNAVTDELVAVLESYLNSPTFYADARWQFDQWREQLSKANSTARLTDTFRDWPAISAKHRSNADESKRRYDACLETLLRGRELVRKLCPQMLGHLPTEGELPTVDADAAANRAKEIYRHIPESSPTDAPQADTKRLIAEVVSETLKVVHPEVARPTGHVGVEPSEQKLEAVANEKSKPSGYQCAIWKDGEFWRVEAFGECGTFPDMKGFQYLHRLVRSPNKPVSLTELTGQSLDEHSNQPTFDRDAMNEIRLKRAELVADLEDAKRDCNEAEMSELRNEIDKIDRRVKSGLGVGGKPRNLNNGHDKMRVRATNNGARAIEKLENSMPETAAHLKCAIDYGATQSGFAIYSTAGLNIEWQTEKKS